MNRKEILDKIKNYLVANIRLEECEIDEETIILGYMSNKTIENLICISSLEYADFIVFLEMEYNIIFDFDAKIEKVKYIIDYIEQHYLDEDYVLHKEQE